MTKLLSIIFSCLFLLSCNKSLPEGYFFQTPLTKNEIAAARLTPEILLKFGRLGEVQPSPDGKFLAFTVKRFQLETNKGNAEIFILPAQGGNPVQLTYTLESENNLQWIGNSERIAFLKSGQIWEIKPNGSNCRLISNGYNDIESFRFSPNGERLYFTKRVKTAQSVIDQNPDLPLASGLAYSDLMYRHWASWNDYSNSHIFVARFNNKGIEGAIDIMKNEPFDAPLAPFFNANEINWSPCSNFIAYTSKKLTGRDAAISTNSDIYIYNTNNAETINITQGMNGYDRYPVFSPNGKWLAFTSMATPGYESDKDRLMLFDFETGTMHDISSTFEHNVSHPVWANNNEEIWFISSVEATYQIFKANINTGEIIQHTHGWHDYRSISVVNNFLIGEKMSMSMATELFSIDSSGRETQITHINSNIYQAVEMGKVEQHWVNTTDNKKMLVWHILPPGFDSTKQYPAILYCQGGPQSAVSQFFSYRWNFQLMAANGYIVVAPNRRGLPGFGKEWNDQIVLDYGGQNMKDYLSAIDNARKLPYVETEKCGAVGASYGGFSVYFLAGIHQNRFKAFISHCGMYNMESKYGATEEYFFPNHDLGGAYWDKPKPKSYEFSPHRLVQNWNTPILIIAGEKDYRVPYTESLQAFNAAKLRNIPARLLVFPDEGHWVVKPQNSVLWQREFFNWLDLWLKDL